MASTVHLQPGAAVLFQLLHAAFGVPQRQPHPHPMFGQPARCMCKCANAHPVVCCSVVHAGRWHGAHKAAVVASSAAGWISRIFLASDPPYGNTVYHGSDRVHTLVTLGTPHTSAERVTKRNIDFVNTAYPGAYMPGVR